jgi:VanZ family protein
VLYESTRNAGDLTLPDVTTWEGYVGHFASYAVLVFCALMAIKRQRLATILIVIAAAGLMGALLEAYQSTLSGRDASAFDALANLLGASAGAATVTFLLPRWQQQRRGADRR